MTDEVVRIIQDHTSMEIGMRMILEALETKVLPPSGILPTFNDSWAEEVLETCLELATGKKYEK